MRRDKSENKRLRAGVRERAIFKEGRGWNTEESGIKT